MLNGYFVIVLLTNITFIWLFISGALMEILSQRVFRSAFVVDSLLFKILMGPGIVMHESSHALACILTRTKIVEFKPYKIQKTADGYILGYVKHVEPSSSLKSAIIGIAPMFMSFVILGLVSLVLPSNPPLGGQIWSGLQTLIAAKFSTDVTVVLGVYSSIIVGVLIGIGNLTILNPIFWLFLYLALTISFMSNPSSQDLTNANQGLKVIIIFNAIWLLISFLLPVAGYALFGLYELLSVIFSLATAFTVLAWGTFVIGFFLSRLKIPFNIIAVIIMFAAHFPLSGFITPAALLTLVDFGVLLGVSIFMNLIPAMRR